MQHWWRSYTLLMLSSNSFLVSNDTLEGTYMQSYAANRWNLSSRSLEKKQQHNLSPALNFILILTKKFIHDSMMNSSTYYMYVLFLAFLQTLRQQINYKTKQFQKNNNRDLFLSKSSNINDLLVYCLLCHALHVLSVSVLVIAFVLVVNFTLFFWEIKD